MNRHPVEAHFINGAYTGHYWTIWDTKQMHTVTDDEGNAVRFPSWEKATIAAYQARDEAEDRRYRFWNGINQARPVERWYDRSTRMRAQAKAANADSAESVFRVREASA